MPTEDLTIAAAAATPRRPIHILLVEDNQDDALLLERHLRRNGFAPKLQRVETAAEMRAELGRPEMPDIVLADYNLPNFSGPEALHLLKSTGFDIPFLMMSGAVSEEMAVESMRAGAQDYVTKQNLTRLVPAVERELKEAIARRSKIAAEKALRASESRFHRLVEAMPLGLLIGDSRGRITYANSAVEHLLGYSAGQLSSGDVSLQSLCPALDLLPLLADDPTVSATPFEAVCSTTAGQSVDVLLGVAVLNPEAVQQERQVAAFIADLSRQKRSEEVLRRTEKLAVAGRLAASIAHEINNPLEAITNCLYLLANTDLTEDGRSFLDLAQKELDRVAQITVQTLRFYRQSTRRAPTDVDELMDAVVGIFDSRLRRLGIEVFRRMRKVAPIVVHDGEIRQVIANMVSNAIDALPSGGQLLLRTVPGRHWQTGEPGVVLTVADTGIGMDPTSLGRIFEPFFSTKGITGTGLGLWISLEIIQKHKGTIRVRSRPATVERPGGTVFRLFLPELN